MNDSPAPNSLPRAQNFSEAKTRGARSKRIAAVRRYVLLVGFGFLAALLGALGYSILSNPVNNSARNEVKSVLSTDEMKEYASPDGEFTVRLPGVPIVNQKISDENGGPVPLTVYERKIEEDSVVYTVEVYDYTGRDIDHKQVVESKLGDKVGRSSVSQSTSVSNTNSSSSVEAHNSVRGNNTEEVHTQLVTHGSKVFVLTLTGADKIKFDEFAGSLKFND